MIMNGVVIILIGRIFVVELSLLLIERISWVKAPVFVFHLQVVLLYASHFILCGCGSVKIGIRL